MPPCGLLFGFGFWGPHRSVKLVSEEGSFALHRKQRVLLCCFSGPQKWTFGVVFVISRKGGLSRSCFFWFGEGHSYFLHCFSFASSWIPVGLSKFPPFPHQVGICQLFFFAQGPLLPPMLSILQAHSRFRFSSEGPLLNFTVFPHGQSAKKKALRGNL